MDPACRQAGWRRSHNSSRERSLSKQLILSAAPRAVKSAGRDEFEAIAPGVFRVEPALAGKLLVVGDRNSVRQERLAHFIQVRDAKGRMRLARGREGFFHAYVKLLVAATKPTSAARP